MTQITHLLNLSPRVQEALLLGDLKDRAQEFYAAVLGLEVGLVVDVLFLHGYLGMTVRR